MSRKAALVSMAVSPHYCITAWVIGVFSDFWHFLRLCYIAHYVYDRRDECDFTRLALSLSLDDALFYICITVYKYV